MDETLSAEANAHLRANEELLRKFQELDYELAGSKEDIGILKKDLEDMEGQEDNLFEIQELLRDEGYPGDPALRLVQNLVRRLEDAKK